MATVPKLGYPAVTQLRSTELREVAARIDAIRTRLKLLDEEVLRLGSLADASTLGQQVASMQRALVQLQQRVTKIEQQIGLEDTVTLTAAAAIAQYVVAVPAAPGSCITADPNDPTQMHQPLGVTLNGGALGQAIRIQRSGPLTLPTSSLIAGRPVFSDVDGTLTQDASACDHVLLVGVATSGSTVWIDPDAPYLLGDTTDPFADWLPVTLAYLRTHGGGGGSAGDVVLYDDEGRAILTDTGEAILVA